MKKRIALALWVLFMMPLVASQTFAAEETVQTGVVDAGNKMCPVMGGPVNGENFAVYKGKRYGLCCPMCETTFRNDPAKYAAIAEASASKEMEKAMDQGSL